MPSFNLDVLSTHVRSLSGGEFGVLFRNGNLAIFDDVALTAHDNAVVRNGGAISSINRVAIETYGTGFSLENTGAITGGTHAIRAASGDDPLDLRIVSSGSITATSDGHAAISIEGHGAMIVNTGQIVSLGGHGISFETDAFSSTVNSIFNAGSIYARGAGDIAIKGSGASDDVENTGTISGGIVTGFGEDVVVNSGLVTGSINLGRGPDVFEGRTGEVLGAVRGGLGNDTMRAGAAGEEFHGEGNDDLLRGGAGSDTFHGGFGRDTLTGAWGDDELHGNDGHDTLWGGMGEDILNGGPGSDLVGGGAGADTLMGGTGWDNLRGGHGDDELYGGDQPDRLNGGTGEDTLTGGAGADTFIMRPGNGADIVTDFVDGEDRVNLVSFGFKGFVQLTNEADLIDSRQGVRIDFGDGDVLILEGTDIAQLTFADFFF